MARKQQDCDSVEQQSSVQDPGAHAQPKQKLTRHHSSLRCHEQGIDQQSEDLNLSEINKHISDGVNKLPVDNRCDLKTKEAKDCSKSDAEMVDVMDALQRVISSIEKEIAKNLAFLQEEIDTRNTNSIMAAFITRKTSRSRAFSEQC